MIRGALVAAALLLLCLADAAAAGTLRGTVTAQTGGAPVVDYRVDLFDTAAGAKTASTCTGANGGYAFAGLAAGTYMVHFAGGGGAGCTSSTLAPQWYANRFAFQFAEPVTVSAAGEVAGIDEALPVGASVLGKVTARDGGATLANVRVKVLDLNGETLRDTCSQGDGTYRIDGLVPGALLVGFFPDGSCGAVAGDFATQYYKDADVANAALSVNTGEGTVSTDIDGRLKPAAVAVTRRLTLTVTGQGALSASPGGVGCASTCAGDYADGTAVTVTATPGPGMRLVSWSGACSGTAGCTVVMGADRAVGATFAPLGGQPTPTPTPDATATPTASPRGGVSPTPTPTPAPSSSPTPQPPASPVRVSALKLARTGTLSLRVSEAATLAIKAERRVGKRWKAAKTVKHIAKRAGTARVALGLKTSGRYRVTVTPTARGLKGSAVRVIAAVRVKRTARAATFAAADPTCAPVTVTTRPGVPVALTINCVDAGVAPIVTITLPPVGGTLPALPGQYTPSPGFNGVDQVRYKVTNTATGLTSQETSINLVVNALPTCSNGTATTVAGQPLKLVFPCTDPDGGTVLVRAEDGDHGVVDPRVGTKLTYTPEPGFVGTDVVRFIGMDGAFQTAQRTLTITVTPAPVVTATPTASPDPTETPQPTVVPTATPSPGPGPAPDARAPKLTVKATGKPSVAKGATFSVAADEAAVAKLTLAAGKHTATKTAVLQRGTAKVALKLSARSRKALKARKTVKATLTVVATDAAGNRSTTKLTVTLRR
ncbi:carboxypeptidase family protein [Solirubrobacter pauli]|uniref:Carboxypeptidase family protein n=1 Tax=Solirubrobacter pauli TaxID=166793 RepID=A0A660L7V2_9ACTN|nr:carboxypeptidase regulatory-like domain-containing protein [Solirubrobacter pauli]RKQ90446.1 carboxypeptidase family protein [Solirubrobacter pauli]